MIDIIKKLLLLVLLIVFVVDLQAQETVSLNGQWLMGEGRCYAQTVNVPGVHTDPTRMNSDTLWYKRTMTMPRGKWTHTTLLRDHKTTSMRSASLLRGHKTASMRSADIMQDNN